MSVLPQPAMTPAEYLAFERSQKEKHEYWNGQIYRMSGASARHNLITANVIVTLGMQLKGRSCSVFPSDTLGKFCLNYPSGTCHSDDQREEESPPQAM